MFKEFKEFAIKGNVVDMAVGVIIGTAFGKIISSLVADVIMPPISWLLGGIDFTGFSWTLRAATENSEAVIMNYGHFINTVLDFLIIVIVVFILVKKLLRFKKKEEAKPAKASEEVLLLREIRDELKQRK